MTSVFETLEQRGFIAQVSDPKLAEKLAREKLTLYVGFDPTAASLHLGNLIPILALAHFQRAGHRVLVVVGGATGMVGDPSGKSEERNLLTLEEVRANAEHVRKEMERFLDFSGPNAARILNNYDWISKMSFIDWLRDVGKHFSINVMLAKDSVRRRIEAGADEGEASGMSYTEFSYMTMQAYDFLHLYDEHGCTLQAGGSDQWGNITAGIDLIRKVRGGEAFGLTFPLLTAAGGEKFGKTAGNAVWLDAEQTSPYQHYQYWVRTDDRDVERYLKLFTFLDLEEIAEAASAHAEAPQRREGQKLLASETTRIIHGEAALAKAEQASRVLFGGALEGLSGEDLREIFSDAPSSELERAAIESGLTVVDLLHRSGQCKSKGEARRMIQGGGVYLNNRRVGEIEAAVRSEDLISGEILVTRLGKKKYHLVRLK